MEKKLLLSVLLLLIQICVFAQFDFEGNEGPPRNQLWADKILKEKFNVKKDNDFELRLWIVDKPGSNLMPTLFILSYANNKWAARAFDNMVADKMRELAVPQDGLDSLWQRMTTC